MKDAIIIGLLAVVVFILFMRNVGSYTAPSNCNSQLVDKNAVCAKVFPNKYPIDGPISPDDTTRKYCCK